MNDNENARERAAPATGRHVAKKGTAKRVSKKAAPPTPPVFQEAASSAEPAPAKRATAKRATAKKATAKKAVAKKAVATEAVAKKTTATRATTEPSEGIAPAGLSGPAEVIEPTGVIEPAGAIEPPQVSEPAEVSEPPKVSEPATSASAEDVEKAWHDNRLAQVLYHDWEAGTYDRKWSISFDERCINYARDRFSALVGPEILEAEAWPYPKALEVGAGTGFFSLNLKQAGVLDEVHVSDVSAGMVENAKQNAERLGFEVIGTVSGAESLPYGDNTFDIVVGHAVIHHIPEVETALREILRVLKPGGRFAIAGEPTRIGDRYARRLGRITWALTTRVTHLKPFRERWAKSREDLDESSRAAALESVVDLHTFDPDELAELARRAGASDVHTQTEELLAAFLGWPVRTFEAAVNPDRLGWGWSKFAYRSWLRLSAADRVLAKAVPKRFFYNVGVTGTKGR